MPSSPLAEFVDADLLINWIRIVKSPAELVYLRQAGRIADAIVKRAVDTIEPGVRECDLSRAGIGHAGFWRTLRSLISVVLALASALLCHIPHGLTGRSGICQLDYDRGRCCAHTGATSMIGVTRRLEHLYADTRLREN